ncbi:hypothetical protein BX661DRAFT_183783 [Kickxella alabastrina]|uniref:uncharacterized protein n=1 Tax=Kickxella alabastrina TaxID=61397 RepID=UPI00221EBC0F|nr:uncharacterized protein BX661DRAFT_183783 [Kickxella alabastrina]KAI7826315.1 hypothetical protein BX661DRAFT_183783 [Kickxella alabastrina]
MSEENVGLQHTTNSDFRFLATATGMLHHINNRAHHQPISHTNPGLRFQVANIPAHPGIRTTNAVDTRWGNKVHVQILLTSISTTIHDRIHAKSQINERSDHAVHPGIRVDIPNGAIGVTMMGSTRFKHLELSTGHGPAHLSDVAADIIKLAAHNGNITVHDIEATGAVEIIGKAAWMDIDDLRAASLTATSADAIISLKDIDAAAVSATTTNARIGLGNVKAGTLEVSTCNGEVVATNVYVAACNVKVVKGNIEGNWCPTKKLYLSTSDAKIVAQVHLNSDEPLEMVLVSKNGPVQLDLPATFVGGFFLQTTGFFKTFVHTHPTVKSSPVLHISKPDNKAGF